MKKTILFLIMLIPAALLPQSEGFQIARLKYNGGGDWYNDPSAETNLLTFIAQNTNIKTVPEYVFVEAGSPDIFNYPFLFVTGHGNITFSQSEADRLRTYMENGGFIYVDDDYGLDKPFRRELKKIFPDKELVELPFDYEMYKCFYDFPAGPPKTHEHDDKAPQGFGLFIGERLVLYYTLESNPSDGWADPKAHNDPQQKREEALKFGTNLVVWALTQ